MGKVIFSSNSDNNSLLFCGVGEKCPNIGTNWRQNMTICTKCSKEYNSLEQIHTCEKEGVLPSGLSDLLDLRIKYWRKQIRIEKERDKKLPKVLQNSEKHKRGLHGVNCIIHELKMLKNEIKQI